jgi:hypothetical protein
MNTSRFIDRGLVKQSADRPASKSTELLEDEVVTWLAYEAEQQRLADARRILGLQKEVNRLKKEVGSSSGLHKASHSILYL